jgi:hypothetical protein
MCCPYDIALDSAGAYMLMTQMALQFDQDGRFLNRFGLKGSFGSGIAVVPLLTFGNPLAVSM